MEKINVEIFEPTCDHNLLAVVIGEEVLKALDSIDKEDFMKCKIILTFDGVIKAEALKE